MATVKMGMERFMTVNQGRNLLVRDDVRGVE